MSMKRALQVILGVSLFGSVFSGVLTYREFLAEPGAQTCSPLGQPGTLLGYPPCVYGLFMYLAIVAISSAGLIGKRRPSAGPHEHLPSTPAQI